jgi:hypothetical protein
MHPGTPRALDEKTLKGMSEMAQKQPVVVQENDVWVIRLEKENGRVQEYRCSTELQARQLASVLLPK